MKIGAAKVDITPDLKKGAVPLWGYTERKKLPAAGVHDRTHARAIVVSDQKGALFALVSTDICYIASELRNGVLKRLASQGFDENNLLLAATHTHSGFGGYDRTRIARLLFGKFEKWVLDQTIALIAQAVSEAKQAMREATIEIGTEFVKNLNRSRLDPAFVFGDGRPGQKIQPNPEKYPVDERLTVLRIKQADNQTIAAVIHFAAHPTILSPKNMEVSADFPGVLCKKVEEALGDNAIALYLNSTLGDTAPPPDWEDELSKEIAQMNEYGEKLGDAVIKALENTRPLTGESIFCKTLYIKAPKVTLRPLKRIALPSFLSKFFYTNRNIPYQAMRIGELVLLAVPGEATTEIGKELRAMCAIGKDCLVIAPANAYIGYIVTPKQYEDGGYASDMCFFGPNAITHVKDAFQKVLAQIQ